MIQQVLTFISLCIMSFTISGCFTVRNIDGWWRW